jgi:hypothetical protein
VVAVTAFVGPQALIVAGLCRIKIRLQELIGSGQPRQAAFPYVGELKLQRGNLGEGEIAALKVPEDAPQPGNATCQIRRALVGGGEKCFDFSFGPELIADPVVALY